MTERSAGRALAVKLRPFELNSCPATLRDGFVRQENFAATYRVFAWLIRILHCTQLPATDKILGCGKRSRNLERMRTNLKKLA